MLRIYADDREKNSGIPDILRELGLTVIMQQLSVGDYVIGDGIAIERKSVSDLVHSVFDKRFFDQISRLTSSYKISILLIEGDLQMIRNITEKWKAINSALITAIAQYDVKVVYSMNKSDSAYVIFKLTEKYQTRDLRNSNISLHDKPKFENIKDMQLYFIESLPNIGETTAKKLLEKFSTVRNICNASVSDLERAIGSRKKAEEIYRIFNTSYISSSNNEKKSLLDFL
ncbi:multidrug MFS transporter [Acidianus sulfidivorans JP7]|uniref:Multidrug MFS transporter n=1 Tax=Acidianus sulfidivorans JP7 TaxID=619593 RepID=A0A2U9IMP5_9CREN|nr:3'-flap repair endonuclease Xpf [Acidianus sulfidivorans]AWR97277.1 multidrug MFS transporter [Acidianus sulfidivorans JP7]